MMSSPVTDEIARKHCRQLRSEDYLLLAQENKEYCRLVGVLTDREALLEQQLAHAHARILTLEQQQQDHQQQLQQQLQENSQLASRMAHYDRIR